MAEFDFEERKTECLLDPYDNDLSELPMMQKKFKTNAPYSKYPTMIDYEIDPSARNPTADPLLDGPPQLEFEGKTLHALLDPHVANQSAPLNSI